MKHIFISYIIISLISCRSYREKMLQKNSRISLSETNKGIRYGFQIIEKDSQNRRWYFATDSVISFHPDDGLFSKGGQLYITESRIGLQHVQVEVDSLEQKQEVNAWSDSKTHSRVWYTNLWAWILLLGVAGVVSYCVKACK